MYYCAIRCVIPKGITLERLCPRRTGVSQLFLGSVILEQVANLCEEGDVGWHGDGLGGGVLLLFLHPCGEDVHRLDDEEENHGGDGDEGNDGVEDRGDAERRAAGEDVEHDEHGIDDAANK